MGIFLCFRLMRCFLRILSAGFKIHNEFFSSGRSLSLDVENLEIGLQALSFRKTSAIPTRPVKPIDLRSKYNELMKIDINRWRVYFISLSLKKLKLFFKQAKIICTTTMQKSNDLRQGFQKSCFLKDYRN